MFKLDNKFILEYKIYYEINYDIYNFEIYYEKFGGITGAFLLFNNVFNINLQASDKYILKGKNIKLNLDKTKKL